MDEIHLDPQTLGSSLVDRVSKVDDSLELSALCYELEGLSRKMNNSHPSIIYICIEWQPYSGVVLVLAFFHGYSEYLSQYVSQYSKYIMYPT